MRILKCDLLFELDIIEYKIKLYIKWEINAEMAKLKLIMNINYEIYC